MYCANCGNEIGENTVFCPHCGMRVKKQEQEQEQQTHAEDIIHTPPEPTPYDEWPPEYRWDYRPEPVRDSEPQQDLQSQQDRGAGAEPYAQTERSEDAAPDPGATRILRPAQDTSPAYGGQPGMNPGTGYGGQPGMNPGTGYGGQSGMNPGTGYGGQPGMNPGTGYGGQSGMNSGTGYGGQPGMNSGTGYGGQPGMNPGTGYGGQPGIDPGVGYGRRPETEHGDGATVNDAANVFPAEGESSKGKKKKEKQKKNAPNGNMEPAPKRSISEIIKTILLVLLSLATLACLAMVPVTESWNVYGLIYALVVFEAAGIYFVVAFSKKKGFRVAFLSIAMGAVIALQIAFAVTDALGLQQSADWIELSKGAWAALGFMALGFLVILLSRKKLNEPKWPRRAKVIPVLLMVVALALGTGGILVYAGVITLPNLAKSETGFDRDFEAYYESFSEEDVCYENGEYYVDSQLLVTAVPEATYEDIRELAEGYGGEIVGYISTTCDYQISFPKGKTYEELTEIAEKFEKNDLVEMSTLSYVAELDTDSVDYTQDPWINAFDTSDTSGSDWDEDQPDGLNWWAEAIELLSVWEMDIDYSTVKVGIIDSMFDTTNEDLDGGLFAKLWNQDGVDVTALYQEHEGEEDQGNYAHGTHVAGLIAAEAENGFGIAGVSQNSELYGYATMAEQSYTDWFDVFEWKYAIALMLREGVQVINISMGCADVREGASDGKEFAETFNSVNSTYFETFLKKYIEAGYEFLIVKSAGNEGVDASNDFIAAIDDDVVKSHIIVVGAADYTAHTFWNYTEYDEVKKYNNGARIDVYAPGMNILSDFPENITIRASGTSMATPIVTGVIALVWGVNPDLTASQVKSIINIAGAWRTFYPNSGSKDKFNVNLISAYRAVLLAQSWSGNAEDETREECVVTGIIYDAEEPMELLDVTSVKLLDSDGNELEELPVEEIANSYDSDDDGEDDTTYTLASYTVFLEPGSYGISVEADGYDGYIKWFDVVEGDVLDIDFDMSRTRQIVLVLDRTGSMSGTPIQETKEAAINFVESVLAEGKSQIAIVAFNSSASLLADFTDDQEVLENAINSMSASGGTNFEAGLTKAYELLEEKQAFKEIIVLMSDGVPNEGLVGNALINYATTIKNDAIFLYTLGFFENLSTSEKANAQALMEAIASEGCHYEADEAGSIVFVFDDIAEQVNGGKYIYIRIACPVDVTVTYDGETLRSSEDDLCTRTSFGTLSFEESEDDSDSADSDTIDQVKVLRLEAGAVYDIEITGTGKGTMDYTIAYMDENGNYSDYRYFEDIPITKNTVITTTADESAASTSLKVDADDDGSYDQYFRAAVNSVANEIHYPYIVRTAVGSGASIVIWLVLLIVAGVHGRKRRQEEENPQVSAAAG